MSHDQDARPPIRIGHQRRQGLETGHFGIDGLAPGHKEQGLDRDPSHIVEVAPRPVGAFARALGDRRIPTVAEPEIRKTRGFGGPSRQAPVADPKREVTRGTVGVAGFPCDVRQAGTVADRADLRGDEATSMGQLDGLAQESAAFPVPTEEAQRRTLVIEGLGDDPLEPEVFGQVQREIGDLDRPGSVPGPHERARQVREERCPDVVTAGLRERSDGPVEDIRGLRSLAVVDEDLPKERFSGPETRGIADRSGKLDGRPGQVRRVSMQGGMRWPNLPPCGGTPPVPPRRR